MRTERERSSREVANTLRAALRGAAPGMEIRVRAQEGQFLLERLLGSDDGQGLAIELFGPDLARLDALADRAADAAASVPGVTDVDRAELRGSPQIELAIDRDAAADRGLSPADLARALEIAIAGRDAGDYRIGSTAYRILVQLADAPHRRIQDILDLTVANDRGELVRLGDVTTTRERSGPLVIDRKNQRRIVTVQPNVADRPLGSVAEDLQARLDEIPRPDGYELRVAGSYEEQEEASRELMFALFLALGLVFMVLAAQYESFRDPLIVMLSVPMGAVGVLLALGLTNTTLNVQSYIGCIMLGGIVVNNAVLLVDQASQLQAQGFRALEAAKEAGRRRLRPILMTTATTVLGLVPLALGIGEGADTQAPLARVVLGGLITSTVFTLVLIPVVYVLVHRRDQVAHVQEDVPEAKVAQR